MPVIPGGRTGLRLLAVLVIVAVAALFTAACNQSPGPTPGTGVKDARGALAAALTYVQAHGGETVPASTGDWKGEDITPTKLVGATIMEYTLGEWTVIVSYPIVAPGYMTYKVRMVNNRTGQIWEGTVKPDGSVTETRPLGEMTQEEARQLAEQFVRNDSTFIFDGMAETLKLTEVTSPSSFRGWLFVFEFDCRHAGYGDRTGQILAQVITHHKAVIGVEQGKVIRAIMDEKWDMLRNELLAGK